MEAFNKKSLSAEEQINLLLTRNLKIKDVNLATNIIKRIGYYHLSSYMRNFQYGEKHMFFADTEFNQIFRLYNFDKELRNITFRAIEKIEIAYRVAISNVMCKKYNSHWFYNETVFIESKNEEESQKEKIINLIKNEIKKKNKKENEYAETFIAKYYEKYSTPDLPPFWMLIETFSMGSLHKLYWALTDKNKKEIIKYLGFDTDLTFIALYSNWLQPICVVRNICAHHSRLYNRTFRIKAKQHKKIEEFASSPNNKFYYIAMIINYYLMTISNDNSFKDDLQKLFSRYPEINIIKLGFPSNWTKFSITRSDKQKLYQS